MPMLALSCSARSELGRRANNEDAVFACERIAAVADGVGGHAAGEVASQILINAIVRLEKCRLAGPLDRELSNAIVSGNDTLAFVLDCRPQYAGMATTLTAVAIGDDGAYRVASVGDSRGYLYRDGALMQLTRDASLVQELLDRGAITAAEARSHPQRSVVLDALDGRPRAAVPVSALLARPGDRLLLCSDGLSDVVPDDAIARALDQPSREAAAAELIRLALKAGGRDNISVIVADTVARPDADAGWLPQL